MVWRNLIKKPSKYLTDLGAVSASKARITVALIIPNLIQTSAMDTGLWLTLIDVDFTGFTLQTQLALALIIIH